MGDAAAATATTAVQSTPLLIQATTAAVAAAATAAVMVLMVAVVVRWKGARDGCEDCQRMLALTTWQQVTHDILNLLSCVL
jgi:hypothetical protein